MIDDVMVRTKMNRELLNECKDNNVPYINILDDIETYVSEHRKEYGSLAQHPERELMVCIRHRMAINDVKQQYGLNIVYNR